MTSKRGYKPIPHVYRGREGWTRPPEGDSHLPQPITGYHMS